MRARLESAERLVGELRDRIAVMAEAHRGELAARDAVIAAQADRIARLERQVKRDCLLTEQRPVFPQFSGRVAAWVNTVAGHDQRECS
ncbi:MAG: hypothetical protein ACRDOH_09230 [Streptosporangiaceae bacterium]